MLCNYYLFLPKLQFLSLTWFILTQTGPNTPVLPASRQYRCCSLAVTLARLCYLALSECDSRICLPHVPATWGENRRALLISAGALQFFTSRPLRLFPPFSQVSFSLPQENRTPPRVYSISPGGRFFHSRNNWYEGAPGVFSVQMPLYTTSKRVNESQSRPSYAHFFHLLCNSPTISLKLFSPHKISTLF